MDLNLNNLVSSGLLLPALSQPRGPGQKKRGPKPPQTQPLLAVLIYKCLYLILSLADGALNLDGAIYNPGLCFL